MARRPRNTLSRNQRITIIIAVAGVFIAFLGLIFSPVGLLDRLSSLKQSRESPVFKYQFEGSFDQLEPRYEVAVPLAWSDEPIPQSKARVIINADYAGNKIQGPVYIKIQPADTSLSSVEVGRWDNFSSDHTIQKEIPISFEEIFFYADLSTSYDTAKPDLTAEDPWQVLEGQFELFIEHEGKKIDSKQISVLNTPWMHFTSLSQYEFTQGSPITTWVTVRNHGKESEFVAMSCLYRLASPGFQIDMQDLEMVGDGWWPEVGLDRVCEDYLQTPLTVGENEEQTIAIELPGVWLQEKGIYALITYVVKKSPILDYPPDAKWSDSEEGRENRDGRQYTTLIILGDTGEQPATGSQSTTDLANAVEGQKITEAIAKPTPTYERQPTPLPTNTPTLDPTVTITPALTLPFSDNFDQGLHPAWFQPIPGGSWFTSNGRLTLSGLEGRQHSYIFIGDSSWSDYKIEVEYYRDRYTATVGVIIRSEPPGQMGLRFLVGGYDVFWEIWQNGGWQRIDTQRRHNYESYGKITIEVRGKSLIGIVDGLTKLGIEYPMAPSNGIIGLTSDCNSTSACSEFDNFQVIESNP